MFCIFLRYDLQLVAATLILLPFSRKTFINLCFFSLRIVSYHLIGFFDILFKGMNTTAKNKILTKTVYIQHCLQKQNILKLSSYTQDMLNMHKTIQSLYRMFTSALKIWSKITQNKNEKKSYGIFCFILHKQCILIQSLNTIFVTSFSNSFVLFKRVIHF